jgi:hypothetical protein
MINWDSAVIALRKGKSVRKSNWEEGVYIYQYEGSYLSNKSGFIKSILMDLIHNPGNDWIIL